MWTHCVAILASDKDRVAFLKRVQGSDPEISEKLRTLLSEMEQVGIRDFKAAFDVICVGNKFCVTKEGRMGLVPPGSEVGDVVVIFEGASTPYLLRRAVSEEGELCWNLVGEGYIHGVMEGEGFEGTQRETFCLI